MFPILAGSNPSGYNLTRSLRFRSSASAYLGRTPSSAGNRQIWTWSGWVKRGQLGTFQTLLSASTVGGGGFTIPRFAFYFESNDTLSFGNNTLGVAWLYLITTQVFRDPSAWYHIVLAVDTTQATAANRVKIYVNGVQVTAFGTANYPAQNDNTAVNSTGPHSIARYQNDAVDYLDGYLAEVNFIDGQALTPSSFGSTNTLTGVWQPARYTGTYGTNGFYLPFTDNSALTTSSNVGLGKDFSGNGNYWTTNNISITSGVTYDSMTDVPTLTSATAANFCTWNPLSKSTDHSTSNGNLSATSSAAGSLCATIGASSGKWYWEFNYTNRTATNSPVIGFGNELFNYTNPPFTYLGSDLNAGGINVINGNASINGTSTAYGSAIATNDVVMFAMDVPNRKFYIGKNGTWFNSGDPVAGTNSWPYSATILGSTFFPAVNLYTDTIAANFGQRPFAYTPPTGFVALNTYNLPTSTIVKGNTVMDVNLWSGTGATNPITNSGAMKPDLVWIKSRSNGASHVLTDSVRGVNSQLYSDSTTAQTTLTDQVTAFNSNGFTLGADTNGGTNFSGRTFVGWQWQAGQGTNTTNTNGSITSTVSVNASAGFSVVTYTGTGANATIGHGLGVAPSIVVIKSRTSGSTGWVVYFKNVNSAPQTSYLYLNSTNAVGTGYAGYWNSTNPTSSVFSIGTDADVSANGGNMVAYCWTPIAGYSAFGSYTGNGSSDGPMVYTNFKSRFVAIKPSSATGNWVIIDTARDTYNVSQNRLFPNLANAESAYPWIDVVSNGFKVRDNSSDINTNGTTYIYMAFAENPTKFALAR